jgi:hypothetical protein
MAPGCGEDTYNYAGRCVGSSFYDWRSLSSKPEA